MAGIAIVLVADFARPRADRAAATGASTTGIGVAEADVLLEAVAAAGRGRGRWRFRRLGPCEWAPRQRPFAELAEIAHLRAACEHLSVSSGGGWRAVSGSPDIGDEFLQLKFRTVCAWLLGYREPIGAQERPSFLWALR